MAERYNARIDEWGLDMETISDSFPTALIKHHVPYVDGADLENMGQNEHTITVKCYFLNESYDLHFDFLAWLKERDRDEYIEFLHPVYGLMEGEIETISVQADDREETAEIDFTFIEQLSGDLEPLLSSDVETEAEGLFEEGLEEETAIFEADMKETLGADAQVILDVELDPDKSILEQFTSLTGKARAYVKQVDSYVKKLESTLNDIANPAKSLISTINYATSLPGRVMGSIAETVERYSELYDTIKSAPDQFVQSMENGIRELKSALGISGGSSSSLGIYSGIEASATAAISRQIDIALAQRVGLDMGGIFSTDQEDRRTVKRLEKSRSFDVEGNYLAGEAMPSILTSDDIEKGLAAVKGNIQGVIDLSREMETLKQMAMAIQRHAIEVKLESENLVTVVIERATPIHIICLMYDLPYSYAVRILSVNNIKNPNFIKGEIQVYAN